MVLRSLLTDSTAEYICIYIYLIIDLYANQGFFHNSHMAHNKTSLFIIINSHLCNMTVIIAFTVVTAKLNPLQTKWPMELPLGSG